MDLWGRKRQWIVLECSCFKVTQRARLQKVIIRLTSPRGAWTELVLRMMFTDPARQNVSVLERHAQRLFWFFLESLDLTSPLRESHSRLHKILFEAELHFLVHLQFVYASNVGFTVPFVRFPNSLLCWSQREVLMICCPWSRKRLGTIRTINHVPSRPSDTSYTAPARLSTALTASLEML